MRVAIIADWLITFGGAEHVLRELHDLHPEAPVFTTVAAPERLGPLRSLDIRTTRLQPWYRLLGRHQPLLPWMPRAVESIDLTGVDLVISSSHAVAKGVIPPPSARHVCYCHTPMRYAWEMEEQYLDDFRVPRRLRPRIRRILKRLRRWDLSTAQRVDRFVANSTETQERIARTYGRESVVIPPPVDTRFFEVPIARHRGDPYLLAVGRFVPYKRFDLLIETANRSGHRLKIAGNGHDEARLRRMAGPTVEFLGFVPDTDLPALYAGAEALLFPQHEDAGLVLLEAHACGTPVIAYRAGGALDAVEEERTGIFFDRQEPLAIGTAVERLRAVSWDREAIRSHARRFDAPTFRTRMTEAIASVGQKKQNLAIFQ